LGVSLAEMSDLTFDDLQTHALHGLRDGAKQPLFARPRS
jgi:hypothetical protein